MNKKEFYKHLIHRYITNQATEEELEAFFALMDSEAMEDELQAYLQDEAAQEDDKAQNPHLRRLWYRVVAAASIVIAFSIGGYFILHKSVPIQIAQNKMPDIAPGGNRAILTLRNGQKVNLTDAKNGVLSQQPGIKITKNTDGQLTYEVKKIASPALAFNSVETPNGGQYQVNLPDGTKVWINAVSKLTYPERFAGKERLVELIGEAYFEVVHNNKMPFKVKTLNQTVEDIGTHFNINAYNDEKTLTTTLLEGSIKVSTGTNSQILKPGQQSQILYKSENHVIQVLNDANTEEAVAWKNGYFRFTDEKIEPVMRKLARWYNIDVSYEGQMSDEGYYGKISRYKNISQVLKMLEKTKSVHFKVDGRRVTVIQ